MEKTTPLSDLKHAISIPELPVILGVVSALVVTANGLGTGILPASLLVSEFKMSAADADIVSVFFYSALAYLTVLHLLFAGFIPNNKDKSWKYLSKVSTFCFSKGRSFAYTFSQVCRNLDAKGCEYDKEEVSKEVCSYMEQRGWLVLLKDRTT